MLVFLHSFQYRTHGCVLSPGPCDLVEPTSAGRWGQWNQDSGCRQLTVIKCLTFLVVFVSISLFNSGTLPTEGDHLAISLWPRWLMPLSSSTAEKWWSWDESQDQTTGLGFLTSTGIKGLESSPLCSFLSLVSLCSNMSRTRNTRWASAIYLHVLKCC